MNDASIDMELANCLSATFEKLNSTYKKRNFKLKRIHLSWKMNRDYYRKKKNIM